MKTSEIAAWFLIAGLLVCMSGCSAKARPVSTDTLHSLLPFIEDGVTSREELQLRLGEPEWLEIDGRVLGFRMRLERGRPIQRGWGYGSHRQFDLIVSIDDHDRVRAHSLVLVQQGDAQAGLSRDDVESLPEDASLEDVLLTFGRPHTVPGIDVPADFPIPGQSRTSADIVVYGWGNTGPAEYEHGIGNQPGGYLVLEIGSDLRVRRRYLVDRKRWEDDVQEGVQQIVKYWRFVDRSSSVR